MKKIIKNFLKNFKQKPVIYIRFKNNKITYIGETHDIFGLRAFRFKNVGDMPLIKDDFDEIRILYSSKNYERRLYWEAVLILKYKPIYQTNIKIYEGRIRNFINKKNNIPLHRDLEDYRKKNKTFQGGKMPLGYKIVNVGKQSIENEIKDIQKLEFDYNSQNFKILCDIMSCAFTMNKVRNKNKNKKRGREKKTTLSYRELQACLYKKYNRLLHYSHLHRIIERELKENKDYWFNRMLVKVCTN
jgi:hypothetical protein